MTHDDTNRAAATIASLLGISMMTGCNLVGGSTASAVSTSAPLLTVAADPTFVATLPRGTARMSVSLDGDTVTTDETPVELEYGARRRNG